MQHEPNNSVSDAGFIRVRAARVHNLKSVDVDIPRQRLTVITGVSGSGKSSLAFDTIHAESQRRYLESLAAETRSRVGTWQRPDVDVIDGLPPTISVGQSAGSASLRSTLATTTEISDYLRLLLDADRRIVRSVQHRCRLARRRKSSNRFCRGNPVAK